MGGAFHNSYSIHLDTSAFPKELNFAKATHNNSKCLHELHFFLEPKLPSFSSWGLDWGCKERESVPTQNVLSGRKGLFYPQIEEVSGLILSAQRRCLLKTSFHCCLHKLIFIDSKVQEDGIWTFLGWRKRQFVAWTINM